MSHTMTATGTSTKNTLASGGAWLVLVAIDATDIGGSVYRRTSDETLTTWNGIIYSPAALNFGDVQENLQGGLPRINMSVSNLDTTIRAAINDHDGLRGAEVTVSIIPSGNLAAGVAELTEVFEVIETSADNVWVTFTLGYSDPLGRRFPRDRYTASACRHQYTGAFCRYSGPLDVVNGQALIHPCDRSLVQCQKRSNEAQFGASPGVDEGVYQ